MLGAAIRLWIAPQFSMKGLLKAVVCVGGATGPIERASSAQRMPKMHFLTTDTVRRLCLHERHVNMTQQQRSEKASRLHVNFVPHEQETILHTRR